MNDADRLAYYRAERAHVADQIRRLDEGQRHFDLDEIGGRRETTAEYRANKQAEADMLDRMISAWERWGG